jgi:hypothetical protein
MVVKSVSAGFRLSPEMNRVIRQEAVKRSKAAGYRITWCSLLRNLIREAYMQPVAEAGYEDRR